MKRILFTVMGLFAGLMAYAQTYNVTFKVDMAGYAGGPFGGVFVNGSFNGWCGGCNPMTDANNDGIWEVTLPLAAGNIDYKFTVDGWTDQEALVQGMPCTQTNFGFTNRFLAITGNTNLDVVCWNSCSNCASAPQPKDVTFTVDVSGFTGSYSGIFVNGSFNGWCGGCNPMTDMGNDIWQVTLPITADSIEYKFTADGWNAQENFSGGEPCTKTSFGFTNRFTVLNGDTNLAQVCWAQCTPCGSGPSTANVTFQVNMRDYPGTWTNVNLNGSFNGWCGSCAVMTDVNNDSIYEITVNVSTSGFIEYKYTVDGWAADEQLTQGDFCTMTTGGFTNRVLYPTQDTVLSPVCWGSCANCSTNNYDVTFTVDMQTECVFDSVEVVGNFNGWNGGSGYIMNHMGGSVYSLQLNIPDGQTRYKFRRYAGGSVVWESISDRVVYVSSDTSLPTSCFNSTATCYNLGASAMISGNYQSDFSWNAIPGSSSYRLEWRKVGEPTWSGANVTGTSKLIQNLEPGDYEYKVTTNNGPASTTCAANFSIVCATDVTYSYNVLQAPEMGRFGKVTVFNTQGGRTLYNIMMVGNGDTVAVTNRRNATFSDLESGVYSIYVSDRYNCSADSIGMANILSLDTAYVPNLISAINSSPNGFRPIWNRVNEPGVLSYQVRVRNETDNALVQLFTGITDTFFNVNNLTVDKQYRFNVRTRYNDGQGARNSAYSNGRNRNLGAGGNKYDIVSEGALSGLEVYPNPVQNQLFVVAEAGVKIELLDLNGRVLVQDEMNSAEAQLDLGTYPAGVYVLRASNKAGEVSNFKLVKN